MCKLDGNGLESQMGMRTNERAERERGRERMNEQVNEHYRSTKRDVVSSDRVIKTVDWGVLEDGSTQL